MKTVSRLCDAYDAGYVAGSNEAYHKLTEARKRLEVLIERAALKREFESLVIARQILRGLK